MSVGLWPVGLAPVGIDPATSAASGNATAPGATLTGTASISAGSAAADSVAAGATLTGTASLSAGSASSQVIAITAPAAYRMHQRSDAGTASITVSGTYTGSASAIEARFNGGAWVTLDAAPTGGTYSGTLTGSTGQGAVDVRIADATTVTASVSTIGVGDIYMVAGQSNNCGRATQKVDPSPSAFTAVTYTRAGAWAVMTEATTQTGSFDGASGAAGSYFGALSNLMQAKSVPVAFVPCAQGSTSIAQWERNDAAPTNTFWLYGNLLTRANAVGSHKAMIFYQGEADSTSGTAQATYETALGGIIDDWYADTGRPTILCQICTSGSGAGSATIRAAQAAVAAANAHVAGLADCNVWTGGNIHYNTTTEINAVAAAVFGALNTAFYNDTAAGATLTGTASISAGSAAASSAAPGATLTGTASLTAGSAEGNGAAVDATAPGATLTGTASLTAGSATSGTVGPMFMAAVARRLATFTGRISRVPD